MHVTFDESVGTVQSIALLQTGNVFWLPHMVIAMPMKATMVVAATLARLRRMT
jgi:hypothetical protein